ncbi:phage portal protein [uncultured Rikenella sp.]|uniref:phage portal protein n=1 Tax=uncultured Rikenella sp. TaxID=368003 RepID=UPI00260A3F84|nr:phage portal protein [uncultured Rikenella sp.]
MKLEKFLQDNYNYNPEIKDQVQSYYETWKSWYQGDTKFHHYFIYNGKNKIPQTRYTMNMAKQISEDWSDILWSEKCKISMTNDNSQDQFDDLTNKLDLYTVINQALEKSGALGTVATVTSVYDIIQNEDAMTLDVSEAKTRVDIVDFDWIFPLTWNNKEVTECAFGSVEYIKGQKYVVLSVHKLNDQGNYVIYNHLFRDNNQTLTEVEMDDTAKEFDTMSNVKWFSIFKPLLTNNLFSNSPFGIPHFANAIDNLKAVDLCFDAIKNEINDGRKRIFARADMFNYDDGKQKLVFDPNDTSIYQLPNGASKDDLIQSDSDTLRTDSQIGALNTELNLLGNQVGFGENHYHFDGTNLSTATAVISSNSKLFRRKKKLEIGYESSIYDLVNAICYASSKFGQYNIDTADMVIQFDDSIIEDKEAESARAKGEVTLGLISKVEYRMRIFGETEEIAKQKIADIQEETLDIQDMLGLNEEEENQDNQQNDNKNGGEQ